MKRNDYQEAPDAREVERAERALRRAWRRFGLPSRALSYAIDDLVREGMSRYSAMARCNSVLTMLLDPEWAIRRAAYDGNAEEMQDHLAALESWVLQFMDDHNLAEARRRYADWLNDRTPHRPSPFVDGGATLTLRAPRLVGKRTSARRRGAGRPRAAATRSSVKSGDGNSDGEPDSPPPSRIAWRQIEQQRAARTRAHLRGVRS
jgi:hypothetical protein